MTVTTRDPLLGAVLEGRYRLDAAVARGGMSTVYRAWDVRLDRTVAVKVMDPSLAADPAFRERFSREARSVAQISHPCVAAVFDQGDDAGTVYLVMEYVPGWTLRQLLRDNGPLTPEQALPVMESVLSGLAAAHRKGFVHRDVKPENILLSVDGGVRVVDFGLARAVETSTITKTGAPLLGTVAYLAPEQIASGRSDPRSDVYSAGIVLFEMLTGRPPFDGDTAASVAYRHVHETVPPPSAVFGPAGRIPEPLDDLVVRATSREPGSRPVDAGAFLSELSTVAVDCAIATAPWPRPASEPGAALTPVGHRSSVPDGSLNTGATQTIEPRTAAEAAPGEPGRRRRRRRPGRRALLVVLILLASLVGVGAWWVSGYTSTPSLVGLTQAQAQAVATDAGFTLTIGDEAFSETVERGMVAASDPSPGSRVREGATIAASLSKGKERYTIPAVKGQSQADVEKTLAGLTLTVSGTDEAYDDAVPAGAVIATRPEPGTQMRRADEVALVLSKGPAPVDLPDLAGKTALEAGTFLTGAGLKVSQTEEYSDTVKSGVVISQSPAPGTLHRGDKVALVVSKGPEIVTVPNLSGMSFSDAAAKLADLGLKARKAIDVPGGSSRVIQQAPGSGAEVEHGSTVSLFVF